MLNPEIQIYDIEWEKHMPKLNNTQPLLLWETFINNKLVNQWNNC
jgi:hypothetical protein